MKTLVTTFCAGLVMSGGLFISNPVVMAFDGVAINSNNFPDSSFREYVLDEFDTNGDEVLSQAEIDATKQIFVDYKDIESLKGIEYFTSLTDLDCNWNQLTSLDISNNTQLKVLRCDHNELTSIDVSNNSQLFILDCSFNHITNLDVSKNLALEDLGCYSNQLTSLDVSNNVQLSALGVSDNKLTNIDVSQNPDLSTFGCANNQLTSLDVSNNDQLITLDFANNKLTNIDLSNNPCLWNLCCDYNNIFELDLSANLKLVELSCNHNQIMNLDLRNHTQLVELSCYENQLSELDISQNAKLTFFYCQGNPITTIDISNCENLCIVCSNVDYATEYELSWDYIYKNVIAWDNTFMGRLVIDPRTTLIANSGTIYASPIPPTPTPTVGPIPTVVPTVAPAQSAGSFVDRCYSVALGRKADDSGFDYWLDALNNGKICGAQAGYGFIFSGEYINKETTNEEFVNDLYSMYFGRTPDEGGFNYWVGLLNSGASREEIFAGFANSTEFDNLCADYGVVTGAYLVGVPVAQQGRVNSFVARLYNICLNRRPDQAGQAGWAQKLIAGEVTGTSCSYGFVFSPEFIGKEPSNEEFVACMYRAFFGREQDIDGFTAWVQRLNAGATYEDVFEGFSGSAEFANLCAGYGINP